MPIESALEPKIMPRVINRVEIVPTQISVSVYDSLKYIKNGRNNSPRKALPS
jgi:hypothetical protein